MMLWLGSLEMMDFCTQPQTSNKIPKGDACKDQWLVGNKVSSHVLDLFPIPSCRNVPEYVARTTGPRVISFPLSPYNALAAEKWEHLNTWEEWKTGQPGFHQWASGSQPFPHPNCIGTKNQVHVCDLLMENDLTHCWVWPNKGSMI